MIHADHGVPCVVGNRVTVGHRVILHGCTIEDDCLIGMGSIVLNGADRARMRHRRRRSCWKGLSCRRIRLCWGFRRRSSASSMRQPARKSSTRGCTMSIRPGVTGPGIIPLSSDRNRTMTGFAGSGFKANL